MSTVLFLLSFGSLIGLACRLNVLDVWNDPMSFFAHVAGAALSAVMLGASITEPITLPHIFVQSCVAYCLAFTLESYRYA